MSQSCLSLLVPHMPQLIDKAYVSHNNSTKREMRISYHNGQWPLVARRYTGLSKYIWMRPHSSFSAAHMLSTCMSDRIPLSFHTLPVHDVVLDNTSGPVTLHRVAGTGFMNKKQNIYLRNVIRHISGEGYALYFCREASHHQR